jgi:hypothetical protein
MVLGVELSGIPPGAGHFILLFEMILNKLSSMSYDWEAGGKWYQLMQGHLYGRLPRIKIYSEFLLWEA